MRPILGLLALLGLASAGCQAAQCEALSDCEGDEICVDGLCHKRTGGMLPRDSGVKPDSGTAADASDGGGMDAGALVDAGGTPYDGGTNALDAGGGDSGVGPLPTTGDLGFVWAGELIDSEDTSAFHAYGLLQRLDSATFDTSGQTYPDSEGTSCLLSTRRLSGGSVTGYEASEISVIPGPQPFSPFSMYPVGNGVFEPIQDPVRQIYNKSRFASFQIFGTGNTGSVESPLTQVNAPPFVFEDPSYPRGSTIELVPPQPLLWFPSELTNGLITIEVFDGAREVLLTCLIADDGSYTMPAAAADGFLTAQPTPPVYLEIRYDRETAAPATIQSAGTMIVTYRASQGLRYPVNLP